MRKTTAWKNHYVKLGPFRCGFARHHRDTAGCHQAGRPVGSRPSRRWWHGGSITRRRWGHSRRSVATPLRACPPEASGHGPIRSDGHGAGWPCSTVTLHRFDNPWGVSAISGAALLTLRPQELLERADQFRQPSVFVSASTDSSGFSSIRSGFINRTGSSCSVNGPRTLIQTWAERW